jgi:hypothetical protein
MDPMSEESPHIDELPEDLDASAAVNITFPNNSRRRIPAVLYILIGSASIAVYAAKKGTTPLVDVGLVWAGALLILFGLYGLVAGRRLRIDETEALVSANAWTDFPVGHASAQMTWRGLLSRPAWRLLLYSAEDPPQRRAFVIVDGIDGSVIEGFEEANPEDWAVRR